MSLIEKQFSTTEMCIVHRKNNWIFFIECKIYLFKKNERNSLKKKIKMFVDTNKQMVWKTNLKKRNQWITWIMIIGKVLKLIMSIKWTIVQSHVYWNIEFNLCSKCSWKLEVISWKILTMRKTNKWNKK